MSLEAQEEPSNAFSRKTVLVMVLAGVLSFSALAVLSAFAPDLKTGGDNGAHALSKSAIGFGGLVKLLRGLGEPVLVSRNKATPGRGSALMVLTPDLGDKIEDIRRLAAGGPTLIVLPKWDAGPDLRNPDWVSRGDPIKAGRLNGSLVAKLTGGAVGRRKGVVTLHPVGQTADQSLGAVQIAEEQVLVDSSWVPVITDGEKAVLLAKDPQHDIYLLTEPDLLNTYGLRSLSGARAAFTLLAAVRPSAQGAVIFDVTLNGYQRERSLWKLAFQPPFLAATLCAFAAAILMGVHAAARFGAPAAEDRAFGLGKRALADNQAALIRMAKREHRMAPAYAGLVRDRVARAVGAGSITDETALEALLNRLGAARVEHPFSTLMSESRQVTDPAGLMRLARRLHQWKLEMTRERQ